jgi:hypothetical protein
MYPECCIVYIVVGISRIVKEEWPGPLWLMWNYTSLETFFSPLQVYLYKSISLCHWLISNCTPLNIFCHYVKIYVCARFSTDGWTLPKQKGIGTSPRSTVPFLIWWILAYLLPGWNGPELIWTKITWGCLVKH